MSREGALVLVVDDDLSVCRAIARLLLSAGLHSACCHSAEDALEIVLEGAVACMITDVQMQGMSGLQLQSELLSKGATVPIVFITGYDDAESEALALERGAVALMHKPLDDEALLDCVQQVLDAKGSV